MLALSSESSSAEVCCENYDADKAFPKQMFHAEVLSLK